MNYKKFSKEPVASHLLLMHVKIIFLSARDVLKMMEDKPDEYKKPHGYHSELKSIYAQTQKLNDIYHLFQLEETEEVYDMLIKQLNAIEFLTKYQQQIDKNIKIKKLKQKVLA